MKEKMLRYLKDICSSDITLRAAQSVSEKDAERLMAIFEDWDLSDCVIFYLCKTPKFIERVEKDLKLKGEISPSFEDLIFKASYKLGYC